MSSRRCKLSVLFICLLWQHSVITAQVQVQIQNFPFNNVFPNRGGAPDLQKPAKLFSDRKLLQGYSKAQERLQKEDYNNGLQILQSLLGQPDDLFLPEETPRVGLKASIEQLLAELPAVGKEAYERLYGPVANAMLQKAILEQDIQAVKEVARLYLNTKAGFQACYHLGIHYFNQAQPRAALRSFQRLKNQSRSIRSLEPGLSLTMSLCWIKIGSPKRADAILQDLSKWHSVKPSQSNKRPLPYSLDWLTSEVGGMTIRDARSEQARWLLPRGNISHNASGSEINPLQNPIWDVSLNSSLPPEGFLQLDADNAKQLVQTLPVLNVPDFPVGVPLVLEDIVILRTLSNLRAVDRQTGEIRWETILHDQNFQSLLAMGLQGTPQLTNKNVPNRISGIRNTGSTQSAYQQYVLKRLLHDAASAQITSDGKNVYALLSAEMELPTQNQFNAGFFRRTGSAVKQNQNILIASEIEAEGRLKWTLGGSEEDPDEPMSGIIFLGAPLPLNGKLYCLGDDDGELRLIAVDAQSGKPDWSQGLVLSQIGINMLGGNNLSGLTPAYSDGILVCPTSAGMVIGFDLAQQQLLWVQEYTSTIPSIPVGNPMRVMIQINGQVLQQQAQQQGWKDSTPVVADGKVLLTPKDSNELLCIDLLTGELLWRHPRGNGIYLACVHEDKVVLVERSQMTAWNLADGSPAWNKQTPIEKPSGRGCRVGQLYHVPLSNGEIATLDLNNGQILAATKLPGEDRAGNLIAVGGTLYVQGVHTIYAFRSADDIEPDLLAKLQQDPAQHDLRTQLALLHLHNGDLAAGLEELRQATEAGHEQAGKLLAKGLLEGLRIDFAAYRGAAEEMNHLLESDEQRDLYNRLFAVGLEDVGEHEQAFRHYLEMIDTEHSSASLIRYSGDHQARKDRWVNGHLVNLFNQSDQKNRSLMNGLLQQRFEGVRKQEKLSPLRNMLSSYAGFPIETKVKQLLLERLDRDKDALEMELLISRMLKSGSDNEQRFATAQLAQLYLDHNLFAAAKPLVTRLENQWASEIVLENKTGLALVSDWRGVEKYQAVFKPEKTIWPELPISIKKITGRGAASAARQQRRYPVYFQDRPGARWDNWRLYIDYSKRNLIAEDASGVRAWSFSLPKLGPSSSNTNGNYALASGHLLVIVMNNRFAMLDTFPHADSKEPKLLWKRDFGSAAQANSNQRVFINGQVIQLGQANRILTSNGQRSLFGRVGALQNHYIAYLLGGTLYAAHPLTGDILWSREDVAAGSKIMGNEQYVYVSDLTGNQVTIFNATDGSVIDTKQIPETSRQLALLDGKVLYWQTAGKEKTFLCKEILTQKVIWQKTYPQEVKHVLVQNEELALLQPNGHCSILDISSGKELIHQKLNMFDEELQSVFVVRTKTQYIVLPAHKLNNALNRFGRSMMPNSVRVHGNVYALDRESGRINWSNQVKSQSFPYTQVYDTPLLVFANRVYLRINGRARNEYHLTILDSRNGKIVEQSKGPQAINYYGMTTDAANKTININLQQYQLQASFQPVKKEE